MHIFLETENKIAKHLNEKFKQNSKEVDKYDNGQITYYEYENETVSVEFNSEIYGEFDTYQCEVFINNKSVKLEISLDDLEDFNVFRIFRIFDNNLARYIELKTPNMTYRQTFHTENDNELIEKHLDDFLLGIDELTA